MEKEKNINITYSCEETLKKIKEYMADAKCVTLYTSSFNYFTSRNTMMVNSILNLIADFSRQDGKEASIVTDFYIDKESFTDSDLGRAREFEYRGIPVKVVHKKSAIDKFLSSSSKHSSMLLSNLAPSSPSLETKDLASLSRSCFNVFKQSLIISLQSS